MKSHLFIVGEPSWAYVGFLSSREKLDSEVGHLVIMSCRKQREQMDGVGGSGAKVEHAETEEDEDDVVEEDEEDLRRKKRQLEVERLTRRIDGGLLRYGQMLQRRKHTGRQQKLLRQISTSRVDRRIHGGNLRIRR